MKRRIHTDTSKDGDNSQVASSETSPTETDATGSQETKIRSIATVSRHRCTCRQVIKIAIRIIFCAALLLIGTLYLGSNFPRHIDTDGDTVEVFTRARDLMSNWDLDRSIPFDPEGTIPAPLQLPVMSFNIRLDCLESNPNNHFTKRLPRMVRTMDQIQPWVAGLQEALPGQLQHFISELPKYYNSVPAHHPTPTHDAAGVAILFDERKLRLLEQDLLWLSETPRVPGSKSWDSSSPRKLNIARFEILQPSGYRGTQVLVFNTHLDVRSEEARRNQSKLAAETVAKWKLLYPRAIVLMFGDFNTGVGQAAYETLIEDDLLRDAWTVCEAPMAIQCHVNTVANSFHGWRGTMLNSYVGRFALGVGLTLHGMGLHLPHHIPNTIRGWLAAARDIILVPPKFSIWESIPTWPWKRLHVDWILFSAPEWCIIRPKLVTLFDVRDENYSSDHFPIVALLSIRVPMVMSEISGIRRWPRGDPPMDLDSNDFHQFYPLPNSRPAGLGVYGENEFDPHNLIESEVFNPTPRIASTNGALPCRSALLVLSDQTDVARVQSQFWREFIHNVTRECRQGEVATPPSSDIPSPYRAWCDLNWYIMDPPYIRVDVPMDRSRSLEWKHEWQDGECSGWMDQSNKSKPIMVSSDDTDGDFKLSSELDARCDIGVFFRLPYWRLVPRQARNSLLFFQDGRPVGGIWKMWWPNSDQAKQRRIDGIVQAMERAFQGDRGEEN